MAVCASLAQRDVDVALFDVEFAVVDVETTGCAPGLCALTEIAAVRYRGGEILDVFDELVDPMVPIPPFITHLTGIGDRTVSGAPTVESVLPRFCETVRDAVIVGHNVWFDLTFLGAALRGCGENPLDNAYVDTLHLARRLVAEDVSNCRLATLARELHLEHRPAHRALADAFATADLLHRLIEAATGFGVLHLRELLAF